MIRRIDLTQIETSITTLDQKLKDIYGKVFLQKYSEGYEKSFAEAYAEGYVEGCNEILQLTIPALQDLIPPEEIAQRLSVSLEQVLEILEQEV